MIGIKVLTSQVGVVKISQKEVQDFLNKNKGQWFTARQISKELGITQGSCTKNLASLIKHRFIQRREIIKKHTFEYSSLHKESMIKNRPDSYLSDKEKFLKNNDMEVKE